MTIAELQTKTGESTRSMLSRYIRYLRRLSNLTIRGDCKVIARTLGTEVVYDAIRETLGGSFAVTKVGAIDVVIGDGLIDGLVPAAIDGRDADGKVAQDRRVYRVENLNAPGYNQRMYLYIEERHTPEAIAENPDLAPKRFRISSAVQKPGEWNALRKLRIETKDPEQLGIVRLLAVIDYEEDEISDIHQVLWFDQEIYEIDGERRFRSAS
jgi:hypothetical protein